MKEHVNCSKFKDVEKLLLETVLVVVGCIEDDSHVKVHFMQCTPEFSVTLDA